MSTRLTENRGLDAVAMTVIRYRSSAGLTARSLFCHGSPVGTKTTSSNPKRPASSLGARVWPGWRGSNVPPMIPIRPPATGRAYPGPREPAPSGPVQAGDRMPTRRWGSGAGATRLPRAAGHFRASLRGRATVDVRTPRAALSNASGRMGLRLRSEPRGRKGHGGRRGDRSTGAMSRGAPRNSERGDELRQLGGVAALHHVDDLAVAVRGRVPAPPQPPRLGVEPVRRPRPADQVGKHRQAWLPVVRPAVTEHQQRGLRPHSGGPPVGEHLECGAVVAVPVEAHDVRLASDPADGIDHVGSGTEAAGHLA